MCSPPSVDNSASVAAQEQAVEARQAAEIRKAELAFARDRVNRLFDYGETPSAGFQRTRNPLYDTWSGQGVRPPEFLLPGQQVENPAYTDWARRIGAATTATTTYGEEGAPTFTPGMSREDFVAQNPEPARYVTGATPTWEKTGTAFNDAFYDARRQSFLDYYAPQLQRQFSDARDQLGFALARAGLSRSSTAIDKSSRLSESYNTENTALASRAEKSVSDLKNNVADQRATLLGQLEASSDPGATANLATGRQQVLAQSPIEYSPLSDAFAGATGAVGSYATGLRQKRLFDALGSYSAVPSGKPPASASAVIR